MATAVSNALPRELRVRALLPLFVGSCEDFIASVGADCGPGEPVSQRVPPQRPVLEVGLPGGRLRPAAYGAPSGAPSQVEQFAGVALVAAAGWAGPLPACGPIQAASTLGTPRYGGLVTSSGRPHEASSPWQLGLPVAGLCYRGKMAEMPLPRVFVGSSADLLEETDSGPESDQMPSTEVEFAAAEESAGLPLPSSCAGPARSVGTLPAANGAAPPASPAFCFSAPGSAGIVSGASAAA